MNYIDKYTQFISQETSQDQIGDNTYILNIPILDSLNDFIQICVEKQDNNTYILYDCDIISSRMCIIEDVGIRNEREVDIEHLARMAGICVTKDDSDNIQLSVKCDEDNMGSKMNSLIMTIMRIELVLSELW